jgi:eukaryotic-like serine/threonine-protein kinase
MPRAPDLVGCALEDRYELHELLGEGAFGRVYRGTDRRLGRAVAVKVIKPWWAEDSAWVERFQREARLLARVNDPGVVQIFDIGDAEEGPYYVAELVEGESLADRLRSGRLSVEEARDIAEQLCRSLASAHREGVVHCDVKPANVLLSADGRVKVGDFGIARLAEATSQGPSPTVAGTPRYMSPEQARGRPPTPATDVYSVGVVLYEMLAGRPPFEDGSPVELGLRHLEDPPPPLAPTIPADLREVVMRALAKDPAERYPDAGAMAEALGASAGERAARDPHPGAARDEPSWGEASTATGTAVTSILDGSSTTGLATVPVATRTRVQARRPARAANGGGRGTPERGRRLFAGLAVLTLLVAGAIVALLLTGQTARTTVPELRRLPRGGVEARARRLHVRPVFSERHSELPAGIAVAQNPAAGARVAAGSTVQVVLSAGPPPVQVPGVVGRPAAKAESIIAAAGLRYGPTTVAAPGSEPGVVVAQSPGPTASVARGSTVDLSVAESPRWRPLTTFSGSGHGESVAFHILGSRWRVRYTMAFSGTCLLIVVCGGPSGEVRNLNTGSTFGGFELEEGEAETHVFTSGPGLYRMMVSEGRDSAHWSMTIEDYY